MTSFCQRCIENNLVLRIQHVVRLFTKHAERIKQTGNTSYIFKNELDKACFKHDSAYADYKDLTNRTQADKVLKDRALKLLVILNMMLIEEA